MKKTLLIASVIGLTGLYAEGSNTIVTVPAIPVVEIVETPDLYIGGALGVREIREWDYEVGTALIGYNFSDFYGVEARYTKGFDGNFNTYSGYAKVQLPTEYFTPYLMGGYGSTEYGYDHMKKETIKGYEWVVGADVKSGIDNLKVFADITYKIESDDHLLMSGIKYFF